MSGGDTILVSAGGERNPGSDILRSGRELPDCDDGVPARPADFQEKQTDFPAHAAYFAAHAADILDPGGHISGGSPNITRRPGHFSQLFGRFP